MKNRPPTDKELRAAREGGWWVCDIKEHALEAIQEDYYRGRNGGRTP